MALHVGGYAVAATIANPTDAIRTAKSVGRLGKDIGLTFRDLGSTIYYRDPAYLKSFGWDVMRTAGDVVDIPVFATATLISWIPLVNLIPVGWAWSKARGHE